MARYAPFGLAVQIVWASCFTAAAVHAAEFYAVTERDGTVALCISQGALLFADRCEGSGRLTIVQPIKEGPVVWRSAIGTVSREDSSPTSCSVGKAKWDPKTEKAVPTGAKIAEADRSDVLKRLTKHLPDDAKLSVDDITAFTVDLDRDGKEETVFVASNLKRIVAQDTGDNDISLPFVVYAGVLAKGADYPTTFYSNQGVYTGGTDAIADVTIKGVVPIAPGSGELALLINAGTPFNGNQMLIRYRYGDTQRIDTIEFICN